jgi:hypothetical protein
MNGVCSLGRRGIAARLALLVTVLMLAIPTVAFGQSTDPTSAQYDPRDKQVAGSTGSGNDGDGGLNSNVAGLPFTGVDLLIVLGAGAALLGTGIVLRRLSAPGHTRS